MIKRIMAGILAGAVVAATCVTGFAANENSLKCEAFCNFSEEQAVISGVVSTGNDKSGIVTIQILKSGNTFEGLNGKTIAEKEEMILFTEQQNTDLTDGQFSFQVGYDESDLPDNAETAFSHAVRVVANQSGETLDFTMTLATNEVYTDAVEKINAVSVDAAKTDEEFATALKTEIPQLGLDIAPLEQSELNGGVLKAYRAYLAKSPMVSVKMPENCRIFKNFILMEAAKKRKLSTLEPYKNVIYHSGSGLDTAYESVAKNQVIQEYFAQKFTEALLSSEEAVNGTDVTLDTFTKAWKIAVILTNARYGSGWGALKSSLVAYGSEIGITQTKADSVYQGLFGKEYTASSLKAAYDAAKEGNSQGGSSNNKGGGASSSNKLAGNGNFTMESIDPAIGTPIRKNFSDIDSVEWAAEAILALADKGIVNGTAENIFRPNDAVTREEFVKILVGAMGLGNSAYSNHFVDVENADWFCPWVNIAYENGICKGIGDDYFGIGSQLTRQDMVVLLNNALKLKGINLPDAETVTFEDKNEISDYASIAVSNMVTIGAVNGVSETKFEPLGEATRAQAATIIYRVLDKLQ